MMLVIGLLGSCSKQFIRPPKVVIRSAHSLTLSRVTLGDLSKAKAELHVATFRIVGKEFIPDKSVTHYEVQYLTSDDSAVWKSFSVTSSTLTKIKVLVSTRGRIRACNSFSKSEWTYFKV